MLLKFCNSNFVTQILYFKFCNSNFVTKIFVPQTFVTQIFCNSNFVTQIFSSFVTPWHLDNRPLSGQLFATLAMFFSTSMLFQTFSAFLGIISINKQIMLLNTKYKIVLHENGEHLAFFKNMNPIFLCSKQRKCQQSLYLKNNDFTLKVFFQAHLWMQINVKHIF